MHRLAAVFCWLGTQQEVTPFSIFTRLGMDPPVRSLSTINLSDLMNHFDAKSICKRGAELAWSQCESRRTGAIRLGQHEDVASL